MTIEILSKMTSLFLGSHRMAVGALGTFVLAASALGLLQEARAMGSAAIPNPLTDSIGSPQLAQSQPTQSEEAESERSRKNPPTPASTCPSSFLSKKLQASPEQVHVAFGIDSVHEMRVEWSTGVDLSTEVTERSSSDSSATETSTESIVPFTEKFSNLRGEHPPNWTSCSPKYFCSQCAVYGMDKAAVEDYKGGCAPVTTRTAISGRNSGSGAGSDLTISPADTYSFFPGDKRVNPVHVATMVDLPGGKKTVYYKVGNGVDGERLKFYVMIQILNT